MLRYHPAIIAQATATLEYLARWPRTPVWTRVV